ncbi:MAG TPA: 3-oxoacyl-ACP reductase FabG [Gemmataceae bacterium]|nr:3-oxoacyl-ACP reductase FabG [Gemmataceae bacterium]
MIRYDFAGKVALVTGSSRGIGAAILEGFARAGATCILHFWDDPDGGNRRDAATHAENLRNLRATVHVLSADVRMSQQVESLMGEVKKLTGGLDILVNNAGVLRDRTLRKMTLDDWRAVMDTNLDGVFHCCKHAVDLIRDNGRIVNIASIAGLFPFHGQSNYAAAKAGVIALTKVLAKEFSRKGITANAVAPGVIQTTMIGDIKPEVLEGYIKQIPLGRLGRPEDVANAVLFFASEESGYITGQVLPVTGGWF